VKPLWLHWRSAWQSAAIMSVLAELIQSPMPQRWRQWRRAVNRRCWLSWCLGLWAVWGRRGLEIGGPSGIFQSGGILPIYRLAARVAAVNFATDTFWGAAASPTPGQAQDQRGERMAQCRIAEAAELHTEGDGSHDFVLASHVLEHLANPLQALREWARVLRPGGWLVLVLPHKEGTFDHRRPLTTLAHLIEDELAQRSEADISHLAEILAMHDLSRDPRAGSWAEFERRSQDNLRHRCLHHHVFDTELALRMLDHAGWRIECVELRKPYHIVLICRRPVQGVRPDNRAHFHPGARWRRRSPFAADLVPRSGRVALRTLA